MDEHDPRPFPAISIDMSSSESGRERFVQDGVYMPPPIAGWRCNLTAMSQRYNLYFVASRSGIHVYTPEFPFQKLKGMPKLYIPPTLAEPAAPGYLDQVHDPHSINHLIVGDLGTEEILLVATDSGNVAGYHTKSINEAIEKDPYRFSNDARSDTAGLRAFFSEWVAESAWGLAIHTEARMIAISANVPRLHISRTPDSSATITVFAFALSDESPSNAAHMATMDEDVELNDSDWEDWETDVQSSVTFHRIRNYRITLHGDDGHRSNIPSISFVNTRQDTEGFWLLSTDITGIMKMWQIWSGVCRHTWHFGADGTNPNYGHLDEEAGWLVAALDPGTFRMAKTTAQFCGHSSVPKYAERGGESYDLTSIVRLTVPGRSHRHPFLGAGHAASDSSEDSSGSSSDEETEEAADYWSEDEDSPNNEGRHPQLSTSSISDQAGRFNPTNPTETAEASTEIHAADQPEEDQARIPQAESRIIENILLDVYQSELEDSGEEYDSDSDVGIANDSDEVDGSGENDARSTSSASFASETSLSHVTQRSSVEVEIEPLTLASPASQSPPAGSIRAAKVKKRRRKEQGADQNDVVLRGIPTLHCTTSHIRLLNVPRARLPHLFCGNVLEQRIPLPWRGQASSLRRLNMVQQIPELGIVIIGSQFGRCAICALTRHPQTGTYGLRVDWIVPTKRQERSGQRPGLWLLGIATAPVQGQLLENDFQAPSEPAWGKDLEVDGTQISFDPGVVALPDYEEHVESDEVDVEAAVHRASKRFKRSSVASATSSFEGRTLQRHWKRPHGISWDRRSHESRRYRLMMTYADHTVLTYEISRDVQYEDQ